MENKSTINMRSVSRITRVISSNKLIVVLLQKELSVFSLNSKIL